MLRWLTSLLTTFVASLSLLLCLVLMALWALGYWSNDSFSFYTPDLRPPEYLNAQPLQVHFLSNYRGNLAVGRYKAVDDPEFRTFPSYEVIWRRRQSVSWTFGFPSADVRGPFLGFASLRYTPGEYVLIIPHWCPALLSATLPIIVLSRRIRPQSRRKRGLCLRCGYDLRASPDRCPECGTPAQPPLHETLGHG